METYGNYALVIKSDDGEIFTDAIAVAEKKGKFRCFDPVLWIDPLDRLWFIWNVMPGEEVMASICEDPDADELAWGEEFQIGRGIMMNKPTVLSTGEWLFPIAIWQLDIYNEFRKSELKEDDVAASYVYKTSDNGKTFLRLGGADVKKRVFDEHMLYEMDNGVLRMLVRLKNGIGESYSYDRGKTWSRGQDSKLGGPSSRFFIKKLSSGRVLLINHYKFNRRNNLTALLSEDDGKTFPYTLMLDERSNVSYPDAVECNDGYIYITYDRERGCFKSSLDEVYDNAREILMAKISEDDIISGSLISKDGYLKKVVSKLTLLGHNVPDPFSPCMEDVDFAKKLIDDKESDPIAKIFESYPISCDNIFALDAKKLDSLVSRFKESNGTSVEVLSEIIGYIKNAPKQKAESFPIVEKAKAFIDAHISEELSVSAVADKIGVSVYYLSHLFKSSTRITVLEYRNEQRLTRAKLLLINSDSSISDISQAVGFGSAAYFTEIFSKSEKITPSEYRKIHTR